LFWSTGNYEGLSEGAVVEAILNYGDMDDVRELFSLLGCGKFQKFFMRNQKNPKWEDKIIVLKQ